jgi:hypothetical protein
MRASFILYGLFLMLFMHSTSLAGTGINAQIPYSGTIVQNDGTVLADGGYRVKFVIYNVASGGTSIYEEIRDGSTTYSGIVSPLLSIVDGRFEILLGSQNTTLSSINDDSLWVELQLDADANGSYEEIFAPRKRIGSAMSAINAMRLVANGGNSTNTLSLDSMGDLIFTGDSATERMRITGAGNVVIGDNIPLSKLNVNTNSLGAPIVTPSYAESGITLSNKTPAINGTQQFSPTLRWSGSGFATTPVESRNTSFIAYLQPIQGTATPTSNLIFATSINNANYTTRLTINSGGTMTVAGGLAATTGAFSSTLSAVTTSTLTRNNIVNTSTDGSIITNITGSTSSVPVQRSPRLRLSGTAWNTGGTPATNTMNWAIENIPTSGNPPTSALSFSFDRSATGYSTALTLLNTGRLGVGSVSNPTASLQLPSGTTTVNTAPLKFTSGTNLTTPEAGALEWDGTNLFLTTSGNVRQTINQGLTATSILDFPSTNNGSFSNLTVTVTGAVDGDVVTLGLPNNSVPAANSNFIAWVSAANTVTVRFNNNSGVAQDPVIGNFKIFVTKF